MLLSIQSGNAQALVLAAVVFGARGSSEAIIRDLLAHSLCLTAVSQVEHNAHFLQMRGAAEGWHTGCSEP